MENSRQSSTARLAAILALVAAFVILMVVVVSSLAGGGGGGEADRTGSQDRGGRHAEQRQGSERRVYVVKPGDCCLSQIAEKTGVDVDRLVQLNPGLDPQAIHSGDRVKLR